MAPKGMKRRSTLAKGGVPKRPAAACAMIAEALAKAPWIPRSRGDFLASVTSSLGVNKDERHPQQQKMVDMIGASLAECREAIEAKVTEARVPVDGANAEKERRDQALTSAGAALEALENNVKDEKAGLDQASATEDEKKKHLQEMVADEKSGEKMKAAVADMKYKFEVMQAAFAVGGQGKVSGRSPAVKVPRAFVSIGKELGLEMQMLSSVPDILAKEPEKRSEYEHFAIDKLGESLSKLAEVYGEDALKSQDASNAGRVVAVTAAQEELSKASEAKAARNADVTGAKASAKEGKQAVDKAQKDVNNFVKDMKVCMDKYDELKGELDNFTGGPLAAFEHLKDKVAPQEEPAEPAEGTNVE